MKARRVVTAKDGEGRSIFLSDEDVDPVSISFLPGVDFYLLAGGDEAPSVDPAAELPSYESFFPGRGGYRFVVSTIPPGTVRSPAQMDTKALIAEMEDKLPGLLSASEREPGMHTSHTLDFVVILAGEVALELDDGATTELAPGDFVVQLGARHRWHNRGQDRAVLLSAIIGAEQAPG
jgi:mannose-6-phosphate isomerase-like protein (cupin superfamily)